MINSRFHRLLVVEELEPIQYARTFVRRYRCLCDCGTEIIAQRPNLKRGATKSCGCWKKETAGQHVVKHHMSNSPEHRIWVGIRKRCTNPKDTGFHLYGGRGVKICDRWDDFKNFYEDLGPRPSPQHSIDRINVNGNYEPGNCRWATPLEQGHNTRTARHVTYIGKEYTIRKFAATIGHSYWSVYSWIAREGMTVDNVLTKIAQLPVKNRA